MCMSLESMLCEGLGHCFRPHYFSQFAEVGYVDKEMITSVMTFWLP